MIANRYDVMAKYAKSLKRTWRAELAKLADRPKVDAGVLKLARRLLQRTPSYLESTQQQQLSELFASSRSLQTIHEMRAELVGLWERSSSTREQLLQQLQDWCTRAESSGIQALRDFSLRLRCYG